MYCKESAYFREYLLLKILNNKQIGFWNFQSFTYPDNCIFFRNDSPCSILT